jgi:phosphatidylinositol glycan class W
LQFIADFLLSAVAILFSITLYSPFPLLLNLLIISPAILLFISNPRRSKRPAKPRQGVLKGTKSAPDFPKKAFLTVYRGSMMVITCIAILAVDFRVFPRRFAKVENWGTSLMDIGVGSFVFSSGIVSAKPVIKAYLTSPSLQPTLISRLKSAMRTSLPLLLLGIVRLIMVKGVDYAEHVTEYGVHWNFFFTLGFLPPLLAVLQSVSPAASRVGLSPTILYTCLSLVVGIGYQVALETTGLKAFVLIGDRNKYGLIGMNKEGISSFAGYLAVFLAGMATGMYILPRDAEPQRWGLSRRLICWSLAWTVLFMATKENWGFGIGVSRRLANLSYILWVASFNTAQLCAFYFIEHGFFDGPRDVDASYEVAVPKVLEAFNRNGLAIFLLVSSFHFPPSWATGLGVTKLD